MTKALPIPFSAPMMAALFAGTKTQTRRLVKVPRSSSPLLWDLDRATNENVAYLKVPFCHPDDGWQKLPGDDTRDRVYCPYGGAGDRLWVKEALAQTTSGNVVYQARRPNSSLLQMPLRDGSAVPWGWKPKTLGAMYCPRWASRITLEITEVRAQRLQEDLTEQDAIAEGVERNVNGDGSWCEDDGWLDYENLANGGDSFPAETARDSYASLWRSINGTESWESNPWVWAISFRQLESEAA